MVKVGSSKDTKTALTTGSSSDANMSISELDGIIPSLLSWGEYNSVTRGDTLSSIWQGSPHWGLFSSLNWEFSLNRSVTVSVPVWVPSSS